jgi:hypothetical protein
MCYIDRELLLVLLIQSHLLYKSASLLVLFAMLKVFVVMIGFLIVCCTYHVITW